MFRVGSWLYGKKPASTQSLDSLSELRDLEDAMRAATLILNDDVDGAEDGLSEGVSSFHNLGRGVVAFIRATLGFEQEIMRQASERLNAAETSAANDQHRAQHNSHAPNSYHSQIYAPGTEFALCQAMAQLMSAVVGVLNESLTESIKGFYKLRKAYITLDAILKMEQKFILQAQASGNSTSSESLTRAAAPRSVPASPTKVTGSLAKELSDLSIATESEASDMLRHDPESDIFQNQIDVFIHSGANFCFGILLLLISMVPPAFSKLLGIIGFHGDKERGLRMLWQASKFHNLIGALSAFAILGYSNGFVRYCDIMTDPVPGDDVQGYPQERLEALLALMRKRFPKSQLWLLEESRMNGANKKLDVALELLCGEDRSPLKQVEALRVFERSLNAMYLHKYELCAESFIECVDLNSWSRSLYYYIAGSSHLSLYRSVAKTDPKAAAEHAEKATEYLRMAPPLAGKKKFMARQLPFDVFVSRKIAKWEARAKEWKVPLVEAVGVDPIEEMIFFWNGHSRMTQAQLEESMAKLAWSESEANTTWAREGREEKAILQILRAAVLRAMRRHEEAKAMIRTSIFSQDKAQFTGHLKDDWIYPVAHFEMAANLWMERATYCAVHGKVSSSPSIFETPDKTDKNQTPETLERRQVRECKEHLEKAAKWESYELDARVGLKVTAALEAVEKWEATHADE
ncbi:mitochondrial outer membrane protein iml2 [Aspergillus heteromorphus CBS 117.55]|uniref:Inclusion body clearance protein IML2 n=1 Tax=Aspergillus heteromorphus CBS 117.55 TaxID=1448321 RepID=A0A317W6G2_9EURO|nr:mitochondrial outer membrane protein iml2 [Aspergillus heteromorphus CBS 117.55]PWY81943.1 mitochondrial outer membrane protein iml2 [Aspergillus heteromorphus CBS 117.55]